MHYSISLFTTSASIVFISLGGSSEKLTEIAFGNPSCSTFSVNPALVLAKKYSRYSIAFHSFGV